MEKEKGEGDGRMTKDDGFLILDVLASGADRWSRHDYSYPEDPVYRRPFAPRSARQARGLRLRNKEEIMRKSFFSETRTRLKGKLRGAGLGWNAGGVLRFRARLHLRRLRRRRVEGTVWGAFPVWRVERGF